VQSHFHYYATYIAALWAGMEQKKAQQLAYYCQTMDELRTGSDLLQPWHYQKEKFYPYLTGKSTLNNFDEITSCKNSLKCDFNAKLAFRSFPALLPKAAELTHLAHTQLEANQLQKINNIDSKKITHHFYDEDIEIITIDEALFNEAQLKIVNIPSDPRLKCEANSKFSRDMLNDIIYKTRYRSEVKNMELALLGCRLFVYQQTWMQTLNSTNKTNQLKDAFYWTLNAIECFLRAIPIKNTRYWFTEPNSKRKARLDKLLTKILSFEGAAFEEEYKWLAHFPDLIACHQINMPTEFNNWQLGLRYRKKHLLEQAMLLAKTDQKRDINLLSGFKHSDFFKLNKAAEYHANWLTCQLKNKDLFHCQTNKSVGDSSLWQLLP